ncbi:MAG TPA: hypothetical protein VHU61_08315 [Solirubrobacteraceae bacterium]|nr:hypothetical protein [Solirubrobacteraceae bacterium]
MLLPLAVNWSTISALATGAGTLVLAIATFAAVRSSNRSALIAELALQEQRRPIFVPSRVSDPAQTLNFADGHWIQVEGGYARADAENGNVYLAISLRNVGNGIGVCQGWAVRVGATLTSQLPVHMPDAEFHTQSRDLYVAGGDIGMWQAALRNPDDPLRAALVTAIEEDAPVTVELLYSDLTGLQRAITRFGLVPKPNGKRFTAVSRLWFLDIEGPRPSSNELNSAIATIQADLGVEPVEGSGPLRS